MEENARKPLLVKNMEVIVHSTLPSIGGQVTVATDPNQTIDSLITAFCIEKNIQHRRDFILRDRDQEALPNTQSLSACRVLNGDILFLSANDGGDSWLFGCNHWWVLAAVALLIGAVGIVAISIVRTRGSVQPDSYGVVLDAGSSHTQTYVYRWPANKYEGTAIVHQILTCKEDGGISAFTENPKEAGESLKTCMDQAVDKVPKSKQASTSVYLGATAGMRLLRDSDNKTSSSSAAQIMASVQATLATYPFNFSNPEKQARIIEGREEGAFSWVTVNYLNGTFGDFTSQLQKLFIGVTQAAYGALDLGGASTQITFVPSNLTDIPPSYIENLQLYGEDYNVYTHSYLCYGLNEAYRKYLAHIVVDQNFSLTVSNPCGPEGNTTLRPYNEIFELPCTLDKPSNDTHKNSTFTLVGTSDSSECGRMVSSIFAFNAPCPQEPCTFDGVHQPPVTGDFMAFSGFWYTMEFLNLTQTSSDLEQFEKATDQYCSKNWTEASKEGDIKPSLLLKYCFEAHYIRTLLVDAYKFNKDTWSSILFTNTTGDSQTVDLGWSLGFMVNTSNILATEGPQPSIAIGTFVLLAILFILFVLLAIGFGWYAKSDHDKKQERYQKMSSYGAV